MEELRGFHQEFRDCFSRSEPRENFFRYMTGQLSEIVFGSQWDSFPPIFISCPVRLFIP